ncbi:hypothetical protein L3Q82_024503 [Scortum barcoo]|uniref:Uncharacterized protein n=1 Tax=Scortum barcoo TaxID=214431 RepID=A0ACB8WNN0_9TELE|nr:hypothetical protein L3Q82_024503 [Scortum barcoo]
MILNHRDEELNLRFHVRVDDYDYVIFATSSVMKCFGCGEEGHTVKACPMRADPARPGPGGCPPPGGAAGPGALPRRAWLLCPCRYTRCWRVKNSLRGGEEGLGEAVESDVGGEQVRVTGGVIESEVGGELGKETGGAVESEVGGEQVGKTGNLLEGRVQGALVRSRYQNITEMDAPSRFFFSLEKKNGQRKVIHSLLSDAGQELMELGQIRRRAVQFYSSLYSSEYEEQAALQEEFCSGLPQVSAETNSRLKEPLQMWELQAALQSMQGRRAPGVDGLTVEFFKAFWDIFATDILDVFNESLASGSMPMSCRRAVLALLPKKGNLQDIKNWRPVSLLCVDYKLLSKALANRLQVQRVQCGGMWRAAFSRRANDLGLDAALFLTHCKFLKLSGLPPFYQGVFKSWALFDKKRCQKSASLHWLLKEPLIHGARLDFASSITPGLTVALCGSGTLCLQQLVGCGGAGAERCCGPGLFVGSTLGPGGPEDPAALEAEALGKGEELLDELQPGKGHTGSNRPLPGDKLESRTGRPDRPPARRY